MKPIKNPPTDILTNAERKKQADIFMHEMGLTETLKKYGEPHIVGSYAMDTMAWNDLDIYITNKNMSLEKLHELSQHTIAAYKPFWYEAKQEQHDKSIYFHGFETTVMGSLWNFDLWFFGEKEIQKAKNFYSEVNKKATPAQKETIIALKQTLIERSQYNYSPYTSMDVYTAVLDHDVNTIISFTRSYCTPINFNA